MPRPEVTDTAEEIYYELDAWTRGDEAEGWPLLNMIESLARPMQVVRDLVEASPEGQSWEIIFDLDRSGDELLDYQSQYVGVEFPGDLTADEERAMILERPAFARGTPGAIVAAVAATLTGTKRVTLLERDGSAYRLGIVTYVAETPDPAATEAAARTQKPTGIVLAYATQAGPTIGELVGTIGAQPGTVGDYYLMVP